MLGLLVGLLGVAAWRWRQDHRIQLQRLTANLPADGHSRQIASLTAEGATLSTDEISASGSAAPEITLQQQPYSIGIFYRAPVNPASKISSAPGQRPQAGPAILHHNIRGSNGCGNLWPEPADRTGLIGFHTKDVVENRAHAAVCRGDMTLYQAQQRMAADWYRFSLEQGWLDRHRIFAS